MDRETLNRILAIESVLIELSMRSKAAADGDMDAAWSSRVQADRIYALAHGTSEEKPKKPWEHFAIGEVPDGDS